MRPELRSLPACAGLAVLLVLSGCGDGKREQAKGTAGGEILEASVSDAMLPTDQVRSQAPLAPRTEAAKGDRRGGDTGDGQDDAAASAEETSALDGAAADSAPPAAATPAAE